MLIKDFLVIRFFRRRQRMKLIRLLLRDSSDPFNCTTDQEFLKLIRFPKVICMELIDKISPLLQQRTAHHGLSSTLQILCTIRFLATGSYQRPVGQDFLISMSQTSVSRSVQEVCYAITNYLARTVILFPVTTEERNTTKEKFFEKFGFPGIIGLTDGSLILIKRPPADIEHVYYATRKSAHAKNVLLIFDYNYKILAINARYGGSTHDSYVWNNSVVKDKLELEYFAGQRGSWLLGDSGYGVQPWLLTPFLRPETTMEENYNRAHKQARSLVERAIGVFKSRFRCCCRQRILMYSPSKAGMIINACATLHNILVNRGYPLPPDEEIEEFVDLPESQNVLSDGNLENGRVVRNEVVRTYFNN